MNDFSTDMLGSLRLLYKSHGGISALFRSSYFYVAICLAALGWRTVESEDWISLAVGALPTLAGFSIAAFAIMFAVLDEKSRAALSFPEPRLRGRSPLLILAASISHAVMIQLIAIIFAFIFKSKPFPFAFGCADMAPTYNRAFSIFGLAITMYAIVLVLASVLTIFRLLEIKVRVSAPAKRKGPPRDGGAGEQPASLTSPADPD